MHGGTPCAIGARCELPRLLPRSRQQRLLRGVGGLLRLLPRCCQQRLLQGVCQRQHLQRRGNLRLR